ncbi:MAG: Gfo/Idh/MocA family oxidoreductase [Betaproteobacteria bacterium]|nr:MAG: Gfo/Idh/MocA family oxidoreductase [Betaproteobacteria bacterium]
MISVGFVGLGLIGARRFHIAQKMGCRIAFAIDPDPARWASLQVEGCHYASSIAELNTVEQGPVDAIFIAIPHDLAHSACRWALERKAHVLCEKPLGITLAEAGAIRSQSKAAGLHLCAGFNYRFLSGVAAMRDLLREGGLGDLHRVRICMAHGGRPGMEAEWKLQRKRAGGGALIDPGIHLVDLVRHLFGEPEVVDCDLRRRFWNVDVEDNCSLRLRIGSAEVTIDVSLTSWKNLFSIEAFGRDGLILLNGRGGNYGVQTVEYVNRWFWNGKDRRSLQDFGTPDMSFELETRAFLRKVLDGTPDSVLSTAEDGCEALRIVEAAYAAAVTRPAS